MYSDNFWTPVFGKKEMPILDMSVITDIPIGMFMGKLDTTCTNAQSEITRKEIGDSVTVFKIYETLGHGDFIMVNTPEYTNELIEFLKPD